MKKKILGIIAIISVGLLVACGKKDVKLDVNNSANQSKQENENLKEKNNGKVWKETLTGVDENGKKVTLDFDVRTETVYDKLSVVNAFSFDYTPENKEKFVKAFFGDADVYAGDEEAMSVEMIEERLTKYRTDLSEAVDEDDIEYISGKIEKLEGLLLTAPLKAEPVDNYEYNIYRGFIEGDENEFVVYFGIFNEGTVMEVDMQFTEIYCGYLHDAPYYELLSNGTIEWENPCSEEEQKEIVSELFTNAGFYNVNGSRYEVVTAPYTGSSDGRISGIDPTGIGMNTARYYYAAYSSTHNASVDFSGDKIGFGRIENPIIVNSIDENIQILSFEDIKEVIKKAVSEGNIDLSKVHAGNSGNISVKSMYLDYWEIRSGSEIQIKPAWIMLDGLLVFDAVTGEQIR